MSSLCSHNLKKSSHVEKESFQQLRLFFFSVQNKSEHDFCCSCSWCLLLSQQPRHVHSILFGQLEKIINLRFHRVYDINPNQFQIDRSHFI